MLQRAHLLRGAGAPEADRAVDFRRREQLRVGAEGELAKDVLERAEGAIRRGAQGIGLRCPAGNQQKCDQDAAQDCHVRYSFPCTRSSPRMSSVRSASASCNASAVQNSPCMLPTEAACNASGSRSTPSKPTRLLVAQASGTR